MSIRLRRPGLSKCKSKFIRLCYSSDRTQKMWLIMNCCYKLNKYFKEVLISKLSWSVLPSTISFNVLEVIAVATPNYILKEFINYLLHALFTVEHNSTSSSKLKCIILYSSAPGVAIGLYSHFNSKQSKRHLFTYRGIFR